jgi:hypothetical protein
VKGQTFIKTKRTKARERKIMNYQSTERESKARRGFEYVKRVALSAPGKFLLAVAVIFSLVSIPLLSRAHDGNDNLRHEDHDEGHGLEGSWIDTVSPILPPGVPPITIQTYHTFSAGGASIGSDRTKPFASPQHGTWVHVQGHEYAGTFVQDLFDQAGTYLGTFKGRTRLELVGQNELVGVANVEQRDPSGNVVLNRCARFHGVRIVVEPLAPPCEDLEPEL